MHGWQVRAAKRLPVIWDACLDAGGAPERGDTEMNAGTAIALAAGDHFEAEQRQRLIRSMRVFDLVFFGVATVVSLDTIALSRARLTRPGDR